MRDIGVGIIGTGFMGKAHGLAYRAAAGIFPLKLKPVLEIVADNNAEAGKRAFAQLGFRRVTTNWKEVVDDPAVEIVSITTPNVVHNARWRSPRSRRESMSTARSPSRPAPMTLAS